MFYCLLVCLALTLQLVGGNENGSRTITDVMSTDRTTTWKPSAPMSTEIPSSNKSQDHQDPCVWWCNELYGIIALAAVGTILIISIILCVVSCCLFKRRNISKHEDMKGRELDALGPCAAPDLSGTVPVQEEPPAMKDVGVSDVENCTLNSELPKEETPEDAVDDTTDAAAADFPPPEDTPMLP